MLHAWRLEFPHPLRRAVIQVEAPLPEDFERALRRLRGGAEPLERGDVGCALADAASSPSRRRLGRPTGGANRPIKAVPLSAVRLLDGFWQTRLATNRDVTIPHILKQNESTGRVANFSRAARRAAGPYEGRRFNDTDVYKAIEAASYALVGKPDAALQAELDRLIALIAAAQEPDGYLYPARTIDPEHPAPGAGPERWVHLNGSHELYNAGHLYEAAVAHYQATGKRSLLDVAIKNANLVRSVFGPDDRRAVPGHEEIELALVRLAEATGDARYAELSRFFLDQRGRPHQTEPYPDGPFAMYNGREYKQDHLPVVEQDRAVGHAVRATYLYAGMTDIAAWFKLPRYRRGARPSVHRRRLEAAVSHRRHRRAQRHRVVRRRLRVAECEGLYRNVRGNRARAVGIADVPAHGRVEVSRSRRARALQRRALRGLGRRRSLLLPEPAGLGRQGAAQRLLRRRLLPGESRPDARVAPGTVVRDLGLDRVSEPVRVERDANRSGRHARRSDAAHDVSLGGRHRAARRARGAGHLHRRDPAARAGRSAVRSRATSTRSTRATQPRPRAIVNGEAVRIRVDRGFAQIVREWRSGDVVHVYFPMPVQRVLAHPGVTDDRARAAFQRGPLVYALEGIDNGPELDRLHVPLDAEVHAAFRPDLLGGLIALSGAGREDDANGTRARPFVAVPYYAWANRGSGEMLVWIKQ